MNDANEALSVVRRALATDGRREWFAYGRSPDNSKEVEAQAALEFSLWHGLLAWDKVEHTRHEMAPSEVYTAASLLWRVDVGGLVAELEQSSDAMAIASIAPAVRNEDDFSSAIEVLKGPLRIAELYFLRALRWIAGEHRASISSNQGGADVAGAQSKLSRLGEALAKRARLEEV